MDVVAFNVQLQELTKFSVFLGFRVRIVFKNCFEGQGQKIKSSALILETIIH